MHLHETLEVPTDAHRAARLLAEPALAEAVARQVGALAHDVAVTGTPDGAFTVSTRLTLPTDDVPAHLRGLVGARIVVHQVEAWRAPAADGARSGTVTVEIPGAPVRVTGTVTLAPVAADACRLEHEGDVRASVPLFGSMVEQAAAGALRRALAAQHQELRRRATQP